MTENDKVSSEASESVFASDRDRGGTSAPPEAVVEAPASESAPSGPQSEGTSPKPIRHVPLDELLSERSKFKEQINGIQSKFEDDLRKRDLEIAELRGRFSQVPQPQRQQATPPPDPLEDPRGALNHLYGVMTERQMADRNALSKRFAERQYGKDVVEEAIKSAPVEICNQFYRQSPDPWGDLVEWHKEQKARQEVGSDLEAFKKRIADEAVAKALADLKKPGQQQFPGTLAAVTATGQQGNHLSTMTPTADVFSSDRRNRGRNA